MTKGEMLHSFGGKGGRSARVARALILIPVLIMSLGFSARTSRADIIPREQVDMFTYKLGIHPDMNSFLQDSEKNETLILGTVTEACRLTALGFRTVKEGDPIEVICMKDGQWKGRNLNTGEERVFKLSIDWDKKG